MPVEANVGFPGGMGVQDRDRVIRDRSRQRANWPLFRVKCTQNEECPKGKDGQGEWQTEVALVVPEMKGQSI